MRPPRRPRHPCRAACPGCADTVRSATAADRRTPYSLLGRATLGVRVTHEKLRLGGGPHGAHPRCRAHARARADCARRRRPVFDVQARRHPDPVGHAAAARGPLPLRPLHRHRCATLLAVAPQPRPAARSHAPRVRRRLLPDPHLRRHLRGRLGQPAPRGLRFAGRHQGDEPEVQGHRGAGAPPQPPAAARRALPPARPVPPRPTRLPAAGLRRSW